VSDLESSSVESLSGFGAPVVREGLPSSYRMRAEGHYVDLLATRTPTRREQSIPVHAIAVAEPLAEPSAALVESVRRFGVLQPMLVQERDDEYRIISGHKRLEAARQAGLLEVPCIVHAVDDASAARLAAASHVRGGRVATPVAMPAPAPSAETSVEQAAAAPAPKTAPITVDPAVFAGAQLAQSLLTISACADLLASAPSDLTRAVAGNLVRAETWRATTLVQATRIVRGETKLARMPASASSVLARVTAGFAAEQHVRSVAIDECLDPPAATIIGDADMLVAVLSGAVLSTLALVDGIAGTRVTVSAAKEESGRIAFSVSQSSVRPSASWASRAFEIEWTERPGGIASAIYAAALRRTANAHGGTAAIDVEAGGTRITISLPADA
jgi:hypothetical protein